MQTPQDQAQIASLERILSRTTVIRLPFGEVVEQHPAVQKLASAVPDHFIDLPGTLPVIKVEVVTTQLTKDEAVLLVSVVWPFIP